jgi:hypothetical protein
MWQPKANAHNFLHEDYSQTAQLMSRICFLDGNECDITDLMADSSYSELISDEGPLTFSRQPGVEVET